jgi:serine/threonine-protein kinase
MATARRARAGSDVGEAGPRIRGRYEIQEEIGRGMMGVVYRALDPALGRTVALKTVSLLLAVPDEDRPGFEQRFLNEARIAAGLNHPGIVVVHDVGRDTGSDSLYIALEYLEGETLSERVKRDGRLQWREALRLTAKVAEALHHAHEKHIVHRDVKPANIMVLPNGQPKLMDFGIAKIPAAQLTSAGEFFGTPSYMSPEQATGEPLDARSDVFSLGAVLYLLLTGVRAFDAPSVPGILARVAKKDPSPPSKLTPDLPAVVDDIVARALAKDSAQRYTTAHMMAEDIQDVLADRTPRHRATWTPPPPADETLRSSLPASPDAPAAVGAAVPRPPDPPTADLRTATPPDTSRRKSRSHDDSLMLRLAERVGLRGVLALIALLAVGVAFPLAARRANETLPLPIPLPSLLTVGEPGHLEIAFEHPLRSGTLRVFVDDEPVLEEALSGKVTKKILNFRLRKGSTNQVLDVAPGEHVIRIDVDSSGYDASRRIRGVFKSGETRRLEATVDGLIKKDLTLVWGS